MSDNPYQTTAIVHQLVLARAERAEAELLEARAECDAAVKESGRLRAAIADALLHAGDHPSGFMCRHMLKITLEKKSGAK